jgi:hypothetical protein
MEPIIDKTKVVSDQTPVVGVYDAGYSEINFEDQLQECLMLSGYRSIGCGDLYMSRKPVDSTDSSWPEAKLIMAQESLPFHNHPGYEHYEWGLEGAKIVSLDKNVFLLVGVCFKPLPAEFKGTRQRIFFALSKHIDGPYQPWSLPLEETKEAKLGEHGHPDVVIEDGMVKLFYQHRLGDNAPWYLRLAQYSKEELRFEAETFLNIETLGDDNELGNTPVLYA